MVKSLDSEIPYFHNIPSMKIQLVFAAKIVHLTVLDFIPLLPIKLME